MKNLTLYKTPIIGLQTIERHPLNDERGYLERMFCQETLKVLLKEKTIRQINHTLTHKEGLVRGLHFQYPPEDHYKLVTISAGQALDVLVDLRGKNFGKVDCVKMDAQQAFTTIAITKGVAHGFLSFSDRCTLNYLTSSSHSKVSDSGVNWQSIDFDWPSKNPIISKRDMELPAISGLLPWPAVLNAKTNIIDTENSHSGGSHLPQSDIWGPMASP